MSFFRAKGIQLGGILAVHHAAQITFAGIHTG